MHSAIWLRREERHVVVLVEAHGVWVEVIREPADCPFSHIVEHGGIEQAIQDAADTIAYSDLAASGGIVDAP